MIEIEFLASHTFNTEEKNNSDRIVQEKNIHTSHITTNTTSVIDTSKSNVREFTTT